MSNLYIGLMSGTSADGIDAALVDFAHEKPRLLETHYVAYTPNMREAILGLSTPGENEINRLGHLDTELGEAFAKAVLALLNKAKLPAEVIQGIGSHGQTIRHQPARFSLQIGDPNIIAARTGIKTVADFRRKDIAVGGHGAPLVPAFHHYLFASPDENRAIVNIGGMSNITLLPKNSDNIIGFDTGPGNVLLDSWIGEHQQKTHDENGNWAQSGHTHEKLLAHCLKDTYFHLPAPKSTGREYFNAAWLAEQMKAIGEEMLPADIQATLAALTAKSIMQSLPSSWENGTLLICGGGAKNTYLMSLLTKTAKPGFKITTTDTFDVPADWMEAMAFAWLAQQTLTDKPGNIPTVTGANRRAVLGGIYTSL